MRKKRETCIHKCKLILTPVRRASPFPKCLLPLCDFNVKSLNSRAINLNWLRRREKWVDMTRAEGILFFWFICRTSCYTAIFPGTLFVTFLAREAWRGAAARVDFFNAWGSRLLFAIPRHTFCAAFSPFLAAEFMSAGNGTPSRQPRESVLNDARGKGEGGGARVNARFLLSFRSIRRATLSRRGTPNFRTFPQSSSYISYHTRITHAHTRAQLTDGARPRPWDMRICLSALHGFAIYPIKILEHTHARWLTCVRAGTQLRGRLKYFVAI